MAVWACDAAANNTTNTQRVSLLIMIFQVASMVERFERKTYQMLNRIGGAKSEMFISVDTLRLDAANRDRRPHRHRQVGTCAAHRGGDRRRHRELRLDPDLPR